MEACRDWRKRATQDWRGQTLHAELARGDRLDVALASGSFFLVCGTHLHATVAAVEAEMRLDLLLSSTLVL